MLGLDKENVSSRSDLITVLLCLFFSRFGAHKFYAGKKLSGFLYLLFSNSDILMIVLGFSFELNPVVVVVFSWIAYSAVFILKILDLVLIANNMFLDKDKKIIVNQALREEAGVFRDKTLDRLYALLVILLFLAYVCIRIALY